MSSILADSRTPDTAPKGGRVSVRSRTLVRGQVGQIVRAESGLGRERVHPLIEAIVQLAKLGGFEGTCTELLRRLEDVDGHSDPAVRWPRSPEWLARMLGWATAQLREQGVEVRRVRRGHKGERVVIIRALSGEGERGTQEGDRGRDVSSAPASAEETPDPWHAVLRELGAHAGPLAQTSAETRADGTCTVTFGNGYTLDDVRERHLAVLCAALARLFGRSPRRLVLAIRGGESLELEPEELNAVLSARRS